MRILRPFFTLAVLVLIVYSLYQFIVFPLLNGRTYIVHMTDPDSLIVMEGGKLKRVQLIGVDAPETTGVDGSAQCFDEEAKRLAAERYFGKSLNVTLTKDDKMGDKDIYGRLLRYVTLADGSMLNADLLKDGLAKESNPEYKPYKEREKFLKDQQEAQDNEAGIWDKRLCAGNF